MLLLPDTFPTISVRVAAVNHMVEPKYVLPPFKTEPRIRNDPVDVDLIVRC